MKTAAFFKPYYKNAKINSILIMDGEGVILDVNESFTNNFGYSNEEIKGKNFSMLFNESDRGKKLPEIELQTVSQSGQADDENYIVGKNGLEVWTLGESLLVSDKEGERFIVKDIVNLQTKKHLQSLLESTAELLERIFESSKGIAMMFLDGSMKIIKVNAAFIDLFEISAAPVEGSRLSDLNHPFWTNATIKKEISNIIIHSQTHKQREFPLETRSGTKKSVKLTSQIIDNMESIGRKIFIMIEDVS